jgi:hypothetical protein
MVAPKLTDHRRSWPSRLEASAKGDLRRSGLEGDGWVNWSEFATFRACLDNRLVARLNRLIGLPMIGLDF